jgi:LAO/AO transport system kinase
VTFVASSMDIPALARRIAAGERRALAQGITLVESHRDDDQRRAASLLDLLAARTGQAVRVGLSGTPGVGKSTFIEALGIGLLAAGHRVAVLAIDPSSPTTGGSILGDKTRMEKLATDARAFVRPSPSGGALGGIAVKTREALLLCEAAGFDVVFVETVGVGQNEHAVAAVTDTFVLLVAPGGGDDLQGQKRGVLELVDLIVVHKADGSRVDEAKKTAGHYRIAGHLLHHGKAWEPPVLCASSQDRTGLDEVWAQVMAHRTATQAMRPALRAAQAERWLWMCIENELMHRFVSSSSLKADVAAAVDEVRQGRISPGRAASALVDTFAGKARASSLVPGSTAP